MWVWSGSSWVQRGQTIEGDSHNLLGDTVAISDDGTRVGIGMQAYGPYSSGGFTAFEWNEQTVAKVDGEIVTGCDRELVRAGLLLKTARCYWPTELVERFVAQNWCDLL